MYKNVLCLRNICKSVSHMAFKQAHVRTLDRMADVSAFGDCDLNNKVTGACYV